MSNKLELELSQLFKILNVSHYGITSNPIPSTLEKYNDWINKGLHGPLNYLADYRQEKRQSLRRYDPEFVMALSMAFSYADIKKLMSEYYNNEKKSPFKLASYVLGFKGVDYHHYLKKSLEEVLQVLQKYYPSIKAKISLDTQPVLERDLALKCGLGWFGKNTMIIHKQKGSYFILASLLLNQKIDLQSPNEVSTDHCGHCTKCIDACPTDALDYDRIQLDASKCISTYTIELFKDANPPQGYSKSNGEIYGCDICQEVCPWNEKFFRHNPPQYALPDKSKAILDYFSEQTKEEIIKDLESMSNREFKRKFKFTPLERTGRVGLLKNIKNFLKG